MSKFSLLAIMLLMVIDALTNSSQDDLKESMERGREIYMGYCITCHMDEGQGIEGVFPPLAESDYLMADKQRSIRIVKYGQQGEISVNGVTYDNFMTALGLEDQEVVDVLNFVRNSWGNEGEIVSLDEVTAIED